MRSSINPSACSATGSSSPILKGIYEEGGRIRHGAPGAGLFHTAEFLNKLEAHKPMIDVSLEDVTSLEIRDTVNLLRNLHKSL
ncbi:hypothetical protein ACFSQ7_31300 [Paenibacillus rhizoplanae]